MLNTDILALSFVTLMFILSLKYAEPHYRLSLLIVFVVLLVLYKFINDNRKKKLDYE